MYTEDNIDCAYDRMMEEKMLENKEFNEKTLNKIPIEDFVFSNLQHIETEETLGNYEDLTKDTQLEAQMEDIRCQ